MQVFHIGIKHAPYIKGQIVKTPLGFGLVVNWPLIL